MTTDLKDRKCLVTGASRGLGAAIAGRLRAAGADLLLTARSEETLRAAAKDLPPGPGRVEIFPADLSLPDAPAAIAAEAKKLFGALDVLVCNAAAHGPIGPFRLSQRQEWERTFELDFFAPARLVRECLPLMSGGERRGKMIFLSGGGATGPRPNFTAYGTAKTALVRLAENLASELAPLSIDVNCIAPGAMPTALLREVLETGPEKAGQAEYAAAEKAAKAGDAVMQKAAALALYLASPGSDGVSGRLISAAWDNWEDLAARAGELASSDIYTLRRIVPSDRGKDWD